MLLFLPHNATHYNIGLTCHISRFYRVLVVAPSRKSFEGLEQFCEASSKPLVIGPLRSRSRVFYAVSRPVAAIVADIVHANTALDAIRTGRVDRLVVTEHGHLDPSLIDHNHEYYAREALSLAKLSEQGVPIVTISRFSAERLRRLYGVKIAKVVHHGVLPSFYSPRPRLGPQSPPRILWVSRLVKSKEPLVLVEALRILREKYAIRFIAVMVGKGVLEGRVRKSIEDYGLKHSTTILAPKYSLVSMPLLYRSFDLLVHTSRAESFGLVVLEAMASGMPVVVPREGGAYEVAGAGAPSYEPGDAGELAARIYELLSSEDAYARAARYSFERAKMFSWRKAAREYIGLYEKLA